MRCLPGASICTFFCLSALATIRQAVVSHRSNGEGSAMVRMQSYIIPVRSYCPLCSSTVYCKLLQ